MFFKIYIAFIALQIAASVHAIFRFALAAKGLPFESDYFYWLSIYQFPAHKYELVAIALSLFQVILVSFITFKNQHVELIHANIKKYFSLFFAICIGNLIIVSLAHSIAVIYLTFLISLFMTVVPCFQLSRFKSSTFNLNKCLNTRNLKYLSITILLFSFLSISYVIYPFYKGPIFYNEYITDLDGETYISSPIDDYVDNINFLSDPKIFNGKLKEFDKYSKDSYLDNCELYSINISIEIAKRLIEEFPSSVTYQPSNQKLCISYYAPESLGAKLNLLNIKLDSHPIVGSRLDKKVIDEFIRKNEFQIYMTYDLLENYFHHHLQYLYPILKMRHGFSFDEITSLYGRSYILLDTASSFFGNDYLSILKIIYSTYLIYLVMIVVVGWLVLRNYTYVAFLSAIYTAFVAKLGYITLFTGVGYAPLRYFPDIIVFAFLYFAIKNKNIIYYFLAFLFAALALWLDNVFGALISISLITFCISDFVFFKNRNNLVSLTLMIITLILFALYLNHLQPPNPYVGGFLNGIWGFPINLKEYYTILLFIAIQLYIGLRNTKNDASSKIFIFPLILLCGYIFYWANLPNYGHLYKIILPGALLLVINLKFSKSFNRYKHHGILLQLMLIVSGCMLFVGVNKFHSGFQRVELLRHNSKIYNFSLEKTIFNTTINPRIFHETTRLIQKYSPEDTITLISKFDSILLWISNKVSGLTTHDLGSVNNSYISNDGIVKYLSNNLPTYIYVDNAYFVKNRSLLGYSNNLGMPQAMVDRQYEKNGREESLYRLFLQVECKYNYIESGGLLAVYKLKDNYETSVCKVPAF